MSSEDSVSQTAKAVQEIAKVTSKAIDAGQRFGGFISRYVAGPIEQGMGIFEDKLKYAMGTSGQINAARRTAPTGSRLDSAHTSNST